MYIWTLSKINTITNNTNKKIARAGNRTRELVQRSLERYLLDTKSTKCIDCSQAV